MKRTHCRNGHPYNKANTFVRENGSRECRACRRAAKKRWEATPTGQAWLERVAAYKQAPEYKTWRKEYDRARKKKGFRES